MITFWIHQTLWLFASASVTYSNIDLILPAHFWLLLLAVLHQILQSYRWHQLANDWFDAFISDSAENPT